MPTGDVILGERKEEALRAVGETITFAPARAVALVLLDEGLRLLDVALDGDELLDLPDALNPVHRSRPA